MIGIFKQKSPANLLLLLIMGVLLKLPLFSSAYNPPAGDREENGLLFNLVADFLTPYAGGFPLLFPLLTFLFLFLQAMMLTRFMNAQRMVSKTTYLPAMAYLLITSFLPEWNYFSAPLVVNTFLLLILSILFTIYNQESIKGSIFNVGLLLGIAGFVFAPAFTFLIWIFLAIAIIRPFRINEWLICLLGVTTPFYFYAAYLFIDGSWSWDAFLPSLSIELPFVRQSAWLAGAAFLIMLPFLIGGYYVQENLRRMLINVRKGWSLLLLYLLAALLLLFVNTSGDFSNWIMALVPIAAFHAGAYQYATSKAFPLVTFWLAIAFILAFQYLGPGW